MDYTKHQIPSRENWELLEGSGIDAALNGGFFSGLCSAFGALEVKVT